MEIIATIAKWVVIALLIAAVAATVGGFIKGVELAGQGISRATTPNEMPMRRGVDTASWAFGTLVDTPVGSNTPVSILDALKLFVTFLVSAGSLMLVWKVLQYFIGNN